MITYARLQHFRSYTDGSFEFDPGVNIIVGPNASGKTTLLEAVLVGVSGRSFKASDKELLETGSEWSRVDIGTDTATRVTKIVLKGEKTVKVFQVDEKEYKRLPREQTLPSVLFEPNHLFLIHGSPELRRSFMDELLSQTVPGYTTTLNHYKRVLLQRNALLKQPGTLNKDQLFVWNLRMSELAGRIVQERRDLITKFNKHAGDLYSEVSGVKTNIQIEYLTPINQTNYETSFLQTLEKNIDKDKVLGFTSAGPHREDLTVHITSKEAREVASRGEIRTIILVLKMLEARFIEEARGKRPLLLFDDVFSELDGKRRQALVAFLKPYQSLITTTDADVVIDHFTNTANVIALDLKTKF